MNSVSLSKVPLRSLRTSQPLFRLGSSIACRQKPVFFSRPAPMPKSFSTSRIYSGKISFADYLAKEREKEAKSKDAIMEELRKDPRLTEDQAKAAFRTINIISNMAFFAFVGAGGWVIWKIYRWLGVTPVEPVDIRED